MKWLMELKPDGTRQSETDGQIGEHSQGKWKGVEHSSLMAMSHVEYSSRSCDRVRKGI